ncbi:uncharacterized protein [Pocillopora verrucosa]|uniref:uncharacterized protein n=1 Tax=Pocillopora verrucosa TaxID=203993 RepID=UPI003342A130
MRDLIIGIWSRVLLRPRERTRSLKHEPGREKVLFRFLALVSSVIRLEYQTRPVSCAKEKVLFRFLAFGFISHTTRISNKTSFLCKRGSLISISCFWFSSVIRLEYQTRQASCVKDNFYISFVILVP